MQFTSFFHWASAWVGAGVLAFSLEAEPKELMVYVGTYTRAEDQGIHWLKMDLGTGKLTEAGKLAGQKNPSFLAIHPNRKFLYAVNEIGNFNGEKAGGVSAYAIDPATGALTFLNQQSSKGGAPCHLCRIYTSPTPRDRLQALMAATG